MTCPVCEGEGELQGGVIHCTACGTIFDKDTLSEDASDRVRERKVPTMPEGLDVELGNGTSGHLRIGWPQALSAGNGLGVLAIVLGLIPTLLLGAALEIIAEGGSVEWARTGSVIGGLAVLAMLVTYLWYRQRNTTVVIEVSNGTLRLVQLGPPPVRSIGFEATAVTQIFTVETGMKGDPRQPLAYGLRALMKDDSTVPLLDLLPTPDVALWVEQQLESTLGIVDVAVDGEITTGRTLTVSS